MIRRAWWLALVLPAAALAQRPEEADMFGAPAAAADAGTAGVDARLHEEAIFSAPDAGIAASQLEPKSRDEEALEGGKIKDAFEAGGEAVEDPLKIGGLFYFRLLSSGGLAQTFANSRISAPTLVDGYFDARPSDRVRGTLVARMNYDATLPVNVTTTTLVLGKDGSVTPVPVTTTNPRVALDQALLRFDVEHLVFITVGKQHVKWGVSRIWNPTDYLTPTIRDPLAFIDTRLGASMLKVHVPWESQGANFYVIGLLDNQGPATSFGKLGVALRGEAVFFSTAEVGLGAVFQQGSKPKYAIDVSSPLGPVDVYGEFAIKKGSNTPLIRCVGGDNPCPFMGLQSYAIYEPPGWTPAISGGVEYSFKYAENETATVGAEYFYNYNGTNDPSLYPAQLITGTFVPFYTGNHYAALFASVIGPGSWDKTAFFLFNLANLSDLSAVSRLNFSVQALTYLTVEAFAAVHYGNPSGEFRLGINTPAFTIPMGVAPPVPVPALNIAAQLWEAGMGLRVNL